MGIVELSKFDQKFGNARIHNPFIGNIHVTGPREKISPI
jgi:hypothetical protein